MEDQLSPLAVTHLLQHTLRSLCNHENSQWVYAVFWRILPRNYPPPKWDGQGAYDRSRGNRRNWILVWEDGYCNFAASTADMNSGDCPSSSTVYGNCEFQQYQGLQPDLFFKMSHEIYNYGEGLIGKVAADHSHKWIYKEPNDHLDTNILSAWHNSADSQPRTWEAQFQSGIKTIALIAVREGVVQLGAVHKVVEDLSYVVLLRKKFSYIESIPGVLLPHPSSSPFPLRVESYGAISPDTTWHYHHQLQPNTIAPPPTEFYDHFNQNPYKITPSMSSLEALLSKLPSVMPPSQPQQQPGSSYCHEESEYQQHVGIQRPIEFMLAKEEVDDDNDHNNNNGNACRHAQDHEHEHDGGETSSSLQYHGYEL